MEQKKIIRICGRRAPGQRPVTQLEPVVRIGSSHSLSRASAIGDVHETNECPRSATSHSMVDVRGPQSCQEDPVIEEKYDKFSPQKFALLAQLLPRLERDNVGCSLSSLMDSGVIVMTGKKAKVSSVRTQILELACKMHVFPLDIHIPKDYETTVLRDKRCEKKQQEWLKKHDTSAHVYENQGCFSVIVERKSEEEKVRDLLENFYKCHKFVLQHGQEHRFRTRDYRLKMDKLQDQYLVFLSQGDKLELYGVATDVDQARMEMQELLVDDTLDKTTAVLTLECEEQWRFINNHCKQQLTTCLMRSTVESGCSNGDQFLVTLSGSGDSASDAAAAVEKDLVANISATDLTLKGKSVLGTMKTWDIRMSRLQEEDTCVIRSTLVQGDDESTDPSCPDTEHMVLSHKIPDDQIQAKASTGTGIPNLEIKVGTISEFQTDVIVCPVGLKKKPLVEMGAIPRVLAGVDDSLEKAFSKKVSDDKGLKEGEIVSVKPSGELAKHCKYVYFLGMTRWRAEGSEGVLQVMINNCLKEAKKLSSITFPTLGCGQYLKFPIDRVASCFKICVAKTDYKKLKVVIACYNDKTQRAVMAAPGTLGDTRSKPRVAPRPRKRTVTVNPCYMDILFRIYTKSHEKGDEIKAKINNYVSEIYAEESISLHDWEEIDYENQEMIMKKHGQNLRIVEDKKTKSLMLAGERNLVESVKMKLVELTTGPLQPKKQLTLPEYWTPREGRETVSREMYQAIEKMVMGSIDKSYRIGAGNDAAGLTGYSTMEITNIERIQSAALYEKFGKKSQRIMIQADKAPMLPITGLFGESGQPATEENVLVHKQNISELNDLLEPGINEYYLLHGTKSGIVDNIIREGLDFRLAADAGLFGRGIYFAESFSKADQYADDRGSRSSVGETLFLFVVRVVLGNICIVNPLGLPSKPNSKYADMSTYSYKAPPCRTCRVDPCGEHPMKFDSVLGVTNGKQRMVFREFVIYDKDQSYPEYLVTYKRVK